MMAGNLTDSDGECDLCLGLDESKTYPNSFFGLGDTLCSFNPAYLYTLLDIEKVIII